MARKSNTVRDGGEGRGVEWLSHVRELTHPLTEASPIFVRRIRTARGAGAIEPQVHPYCELSMCTGGGGRQYVARDRAMIKAGTALVLGPGVPHWFEPTRHPHRGMAVYFLPSVLVEAGSAMDGVGLLARFTAARRWGERVIRPGAAAWARLTGTMGRMAEEFEGAGEGREAMLRALLVEALVGLVRSGAGRVKTGAAGSGGEEVSEPLRKALAFLGAHYRGVIYSEQVAGAAGVSETALKSLFRKGLGMSWVHYLQSLRVRRAMELLQARGASVQGAAMDVGFESLSHFNATFRAFTGSSPKQHLRRLGR
jgi:AraC-like DNA-binding protein